MSIVNCAKFRGINMGLYERIKEIAKSKGYSINKLEKELGFARSSISKFNKNVPSMEKIRQIAEALSVTTDDILSDNSISNGLITCKDCGLTYDSSSPEDVETHLEQHTAWEKAVKKFGEIYSDGVKREQLKAENKNISHDLSLPLEERCEAQLRVLRCLFSRSLAANHYSLEHIPFDAYVAMMLNNSSYQKYNLEDDLQQALIEKYGTAPGISSGTIYHIPKTLNGINERDERDIKRDLDRIMEQLSNQEYGPAAYDGEDLSPEAAELFRDELEIALRRLKLINKEKYNPRKNKE